MMRNLLLAMVACLLPVFSFAVQLRPEASSGAPGIVKAGDPVVLAFDRPVSSAEDAVQVRTLNGRSLDITTHISGTNLILRADDGWPEAGSLVIEIGDGFLLQGKPYSGPSTIPLLVRGDEWQELEQSLNKNEPRKTKSDGYLENGVEVYPLPFTPNGDRVNDELHIARPGIGFFDPFIRIFSIDGVRVMSIGGSALRNGEVIWDGVNRLGHEIRPGPYFIIVEEQSEIIASGVIYVLR